jgi:hypothetical protein
MNWRAVFREWALDMRWRLREPMIWIVGICAFSAGFYLGAELVVYLNGGY